MATIAQKRVEAADTKPPVAKKQPSGSLRSDIKRFTRDRLIAAAMDSFIADGFRVTSVERIAELAGTTVPTFYRHFSSKNELLKPLQEHLQVETRQTIARLDYIETINFRSIRKWLDGYVALWARAHKLCVAYWEVMEIDSDLAANAIPLTLSDLSSATDFFDRFEGSDRSSAQLRLALVIPMLDRAMRVIDSVRDEGLKAQAFDELANMIVLSLRSPGAVD